MLNRQTIGLIWHFGRAYPRRTVALVALLILSGVAEGMGIITLLPLLELAGNSDVSQVSGLTAAVRDGLTSLGIAPRLGLLLCLVVLGMLLKALFYLLAMREVGYTVAQVGTDLRLQVVRSLLRTRWSYFISQPAGRFANAVGVEAGRAAQAYRSACSMLAAAIQVGIYATAAFLVSWQVAVFALVSGLFLVRVLARLVRIARAAGQSQTELTRSLVSRLTDAIQGIKAIKAMGRERELLPILEGEAREINSAQERLVLASEGLKAAQEPLLVILLSVVLYVALAVAGQSFSAVLVMALLFYRLAGRITMVQLEYQAIASGESAFWALRASIAGADAAAEAVAAGRDVPAFEREIRFDSVTCGYGSRVVLRDVSLAIRSGQFVVVTGPSGAGKSTLIDLIAGLHEPAAGTIYVDDSALRAVPLTQWRNLIGYVPQEMFLFHETLRQNITLGDRAVSDQDIRRALELAGAWEFVAALPAGWDTIVGERGSRFSGGQRQRIAIARALVHRPRLLILDEITTSLDPAAEAGVCETLKALAGGVTIVAVSHQPALVEAADMVYRVASGRVTVVPARPEVLLS